MAVCAPDGIVLLALQQVIVARRKAELRLARIGRVALGIVLVGGDADVDRPVIGGVHHQLDQLVAVRDCIDAIEIGLERGQTARLDPSLIHPRGISIADLLCFGRRRIRGRILDHLPNLQLDLVRKVVIIARGRLVGGDRVVLEPGPFRILEEAVAWLH